MSKEHSDQVPGHNKVFHIVVNGRHREVVETKLTYPEVVKLAFPEDQPNPNLIYTVAYADPHGKDGTLVDGQEVHVKEGMVFNVSKTNRS
jgi:hypothetical protein